MITARRKPDGSLVVTNGHHRLKVELEVNGKAQVLDQSTGQTIFIHEVNGQLLALTEEGQSNVEDMANAAINRARS